MAAIFSRFTMKRPFKVIVSIITLWSFLFSTSLGGLSITAKSAIVDKAWAATQSLEDFSGQPKDWSGSWSSETDLDSFYIPFNLGQVKKRVAGTNGKAIIHILDAHCDYSAQNAVASLISYINANYGTDIVFLEGGGGEYDLSIFTKIRDTDTRLKISDYFVKSGRVNGAEFFAINNPGTVKLVGAEDEELYFKNLGYYRASLAYKEDAERLIDKLSSEAAKLKTKIYPPELAELDLNNEQFRDGKIELKTHITFLHNKALLYNIDLTDYADLRKLVSLLDEERGIDFKEANRERDALIDKLNSSLSRKEMERLASKVLELKGSKIESEEFYSYLFARARFASIDFSTLPNLVKYSEYIKRYELIDKSRLMDQVQNLEDLLFQRAASDDYARQLYKLDKNISLIRALFNISLTKKDFDHYSDSSEEFTVGNFVEFFNSSGARYGLPGLTQTDDLMRLDGYRSEMEKFYKCSLERDEAFLKNIESELAKDGEGSAILFTGGFHADNVFDLLKDRGYSYIEIMPNFIKSEDCPYMELLMGQKSDTQTFLNKAVSYNPSNSSIAIHTLFSKVTDLRDRNSAELEIEALRKVLRGENFNIKTPHSFVVISRDSPLQGARATFDAGYPDLMLFASVFDASPDNARIDAELTDADNMGFDNKTGDEEIPPQGPADRDRGRRPPRIMTTVRVAEGRVAVGSIDEQGNPVYDEGNTVGAGQTRSMAGAKGTEAVPTLSTMVNANGQTVIEVPGLGKSVKGADNWGGWTEMMMTSDRDAMASLNPELFAAAPVMINIPYSELMSGQLSQTFFGRISAARSCLNGMVGAFRIQNVTFNVFHDTKEGRDKLIQEIDAFAAKNGIDQASRSARIVTFAYQNRQDKPDERLSANSYAVYMAGEPGDTVAPVITCGVTGLAILNYFMLRQKQARQPGAVSVLDINNAVAPIARGIATLSGSSTYEAVLESIATRDPAGALQLLASGSILVKIKPIDGKEIIALHEAEIAVGRSL